MYIIYEIIISGILYNLFVVVVCVVVATIVTANDSSASFLSVILIVFVRSLPPPPIPLFTYPVIISIVLRPLVLFPRPHCQPISFIPFQFQFTWMELLICNRWSNSKNTFNNNNNKRMYAINEWSHLEFEPMHAQMIDSLFALRLPHSFRSLQYNSCWL